MASNEWTTSWIHNFVCEIFYIEYSRQTNVLFKLILDLFEALETERKIICISIIAENNRKPSVLF